MNLSSLSQKESLYDHKLTGNPLEIASDIGYTTLNPSQYGANAVDPVQESEYEILAVFELNREREKNRIL